MNNRSGFLFVYDMVNWQQRADTSNAEETLLVELTTRVRKTKTNYLGIIGIKESYHC